MKCAQSAGNPVRPLAASLSLLVPSPYTSASRRWCWHLLEKDGGACLQMFRPYDIPQMHPLRWNKEPGPTPGPPPLFLWICSHLSCAFLVPSDLERKHDREPSSRKRNTHPPKVFKSVRSRGFSVRLIDTKGREAASPI